MKIGTHSKKFTEDEQKQIQRNLSAFESNFFEPIIHRYDSGAIEVYTNEDKKSSGEYLQYCDTLEYFNGWLYGAVQAINGMIKP